MFCPTGEPWARTARRPPCPLCTTPRHSGVRPFLVPVRNGSSWSPPKDPSLWSLFVTTYHLHGPCPPTPPGKRPRPATRPPVHTTTRQSVVSHEAGELHPVPGRSFQGPSVSGVALRSLPGPDRHATLLVRDILTRRRRRSSGTVGVSGSGRSRSGASQDSRDDPSDSGRSSLKS